MSLSGILSTNTPNFSLPGNLHLKKTSGGEVGYQVPYNYTFNLATLHADELAGTVTKVGETFIPGPIPYPDGWTWQPAIPLRYNDGTIKCSMTADAFRAAFMPRGKKYYAAPIADGGSDSNTGLTSDSPLTLGGAYAQTDVVEIELAPGYYTGYGSLPLDFIYPIAKTISMYCLTGKAFIGRIGKIDAYRHLDATATPGIYYSEYLGGNGLLYLDRVDEHGNYVPLIKVNTEAEMLANENTYYIYPYPDHGMKCHLPASFTPSVFNNCLLMETGSNLMLDLQATPNVKGQTLYLENICIVGQVLSRMNDGCNIYAQQCGFVYAQNDGDGLTVMNGEETIFYRSNFGYCALDATSWTGTKRAALLECNGIYANLYNGNSSNQISTAHSGTTVVRIGGNYKNSQFAITDVTGSKSFNVGIRAENTVATPFAVWDGNAHGYFVECSSDHIGAKYEARNSAVADIQAPRHPIAVNPASGGTVKYFGISQS